MILPSTFCSSAFTINTQTGTNCANMQFAMDSTGRIFSANFPYPGSLCTVTFKCTSTGVISSDIIVSTYDPSALTSSSSNIPNY